MALFAIVVVLLVAAVGFIAQPLMRATQPLIESASDYVENLERIYSGTADPAVGQLSEPSEDERGALSDRNTNSRT